MYIAIGNIIGTFGTRGYLKVKSYAGIPRRFLKLKTVYIEFGKGEKGFIIEEVSVRGEIAILKLRGIDNPEAAKKLIKKQLLIPYDQKIELPEDTFFIHDLIGLKVFDTKGNFLGVLSDVLRMGGNDVYQVLLDGREILIPAVSEFIKKISPVEGKMIVQLIEGMVAQDED